MDIYKDQHLSQTVQHYTFSVLCKRVASSGKVSNFIKSFQLNLQVFDLKCLFQMHSDSLEELKKNPFHHPNSKWSILPRLVSQKCSLKQLHQLSCFVCYLHLALSPMTKEYKCSLWEQRDFIFQFSFCLLEHPFSLLPLECQGRLNCR